MSNRFSKPVAFNKTREVDQRILKHVAKRNFSGYVKKLIIADMEKYTKKEPVELSPAEKLESLKNEKNVIRIQL